MLERLRQLWNVRELRNKILFVLGMLVIFRILAHIPIPAIDAAGLKSFLSGNPLLGLLNLFSGGGLENFSIVMLGVGPYITASIIMQLLTMIVPKLEAIQKDGESGQAKINQYTRYLTLPMALLQGFSTLTFLRQQAGGASVLGAISPFDMVVALAAILGGTMLLMWIGELISEKKVGNGISLLIFAGIIAQLPQSVQQTVSVIDQTQILTIVSFLVIGLITIAGVVFVTEGQRNIPVTYAKRAIGTSSMGGVNTHLPLRVNQAGVIPIIFAVSIILFPPLIAQFFTTSATPWIANLAVWVRDFFQNQTYYGLMYFILVVAFTYFYTAVVFQPQQIAENLQKQGGFIPGIRPGTPTAHYLSYVSNRIILGGALFLGLIAVLPTILQSFSNMQSIAIGGTSLLIVVSVVLEMLKQVQAQLVMRDYESFYK
ncbi:MAG: preprotein translocase subunit SecY [Patescibacteria group bacterium]|jgi:preprotein translocase subunit SecY